MRASVQMFVSRSAVDSVDHSGAVVLRLHVQESPDPLPNLISRE